MFNAGSCGFQGPTTPAPAARNLLQNSMRAMALCPWSPLNDEIGYILLRTMEDGVSIRVPGRRKAPASSSLPASSLLRQN